MFLSMFDLKTFRKATASILAAILLVVLSSGGAALGQTVPDDTAPKATGGGDQAPAAAPVEVRKGAVLSQRVLLWTGRPGSVLEKALAELIVKQAFEEDGYYYRAVDSAREFAEQASSGLYNVFVIFEADERPVDFDSLQDQVFRGKSIVIIGPENQSRLIAGSFGLRFEEGTPRDRGSSLVFPRDGELGLGGTVPVAGLFLIPHKPGAAAAAFYEDNHEPAALIAAAGSGRVVVMPFSLIRSAREAGTTPVYSLLLRAAVRSAARDQVEQDGITGEALTVTSAVEHLRTSVVVTLPQGARLLGSSPDGTLRNNALLFELTAEPYPQRLQYVYKLPGADSSLPFVEFFYESGGKMVSGGTVE